MLGSQQQQRSCTLQSYVWELPTLVSASQCGHVFRPRWFGRWLLGSEKDTSLECVDISPASTSYCDQASLAKMNITTWRHKNSDKDQVKERDSVRSSRLRSCSLVSGSMQSMSMIRTYEKILSHPGSIQGPVIS